MNRSAQTPFEGVIETEAGATFINTIGRGPLVFVVHGGPGFDHTYLYPPLQSLTDRRTLVFYDQPGCGRTPRPAEGLSLQGCSAHLRSLVDHFADGNSIGVVAHSWGALVLAGALSGARQGDRALPEIGEGLLINPMPVSSEKYESARAVLIDRMPMIARIRAPLTALLSGDGAAVMKQLLPFYVVDPATIPAGALPLTLATFKTLDSQLKGFDFSGDLAPLRNVTIVRGSHEFASQSDIAQLVDQCAALLTMERVGHFPFWEAPDEFQAIVARAFP